MDNGRTVEVNRLKDKRLDEGVMGICFMTNNKMDTTDLVEVCKTKQFPYKVLDDTHVLVGISELVLQKHLIGFSMAGNDVVRWDNLEGPVERSKGQKKGRA